MTLGYTASELLYGALLLLPPGTNVFAYMAEQNHEAIFPSMPQSFVVQLYVLIGVFGLDIVLFVAAYGLRLKKTGVVWPFKFHQTARGRYVAPHFAFSWLGFSILHLILMLPCLLFNIRHAHKQHVDNYIAWAILPYIPIYLSALVTATVSFFITVSLLCPAGVVVAAAVAQSRYDDMADAYEVVSAQLLQASASFDPSASSATTSQQIAPLIQPLQAFLDAAVTHDVAFRAAWACWSLASLILLSTFIPVVLRYFHLLRHELSLVNSGSSNVSSLSFKTRRRMSKQSPSNAARQAFRDTVLASVAILGGATAYAALAIALAILGSERANTSVPLQVEVLLPCYTTALVSAVSGALALSRALRSTNTRAPTSNPHVPAPRSLASDPPSATKADFSQIHVQRVVKVALQCGEDDKTDEIEMDCKKEAV
ncbi:hypothetical protein JCM10207_002321 [Rhodosporidiobolus poonsookiae]